MLRNYLLVALKVLRRRKFFTFISLFAVSFTLMVLTVATAMLDDVLAPGRPESRSDRTLLVLSLSMSGPNMTVTGNPGYAFLDRYVRGIPGAETTSLSTQAQSATSYLDGRKLRSFLKRTDGEFWKILDFEFVEGGPFTPEDETEARRVAVINEATRERFFPGSPALGRTLEVDGQDFRVVGVVKNVPFTRLSFSDVWVPISTARTDAFKQDFVGDFIGMILAPDRRSLGAIQQEFDARVATAELPDPKNFTKLTGTAATFFDAMSITIFSPGAGRTRATWLWACIVGAAVLFMSLPAINLVNINLSRILERAPEIGVRKAFGATSRTLVGQFVVENVLLTLVGGLLGWALSAVVLRGIVASAVIPYATLPLNLRVLGCGIVTAVFFGLFSGVYPAWRMSRLHPVLALRGRSE